MRTLKTLIDGLCFPEGPRWHDGRFYFSDMHDLKVIACDLSGKREVVCEVPNRPSGLGWLPDGRMIVVSMRDRKLLRLDCDGLKSHADLSALASFDCNDMVVDGAGRAYVGNFGFDLHAGAQPKFAELVLVTADGKARVVANEMRFPNGAVVTPDGRTLVVGESTGRRLSAFDIQSDGSLTNRRVWAELGDAIPDGIALDAEGAIWVACPTAHECIRVREGGEVVERIKVSTDAFACALGGSGRRTLFIATAPNADPADCVAKRQGKIEITEVEVPGAGWP